MWAIVIFASVHVVLVEWWKVLRFEWGIEFGWVGGWLGGGGGGEGGYNCTLPKNADIDWV